MVHVKTEITIARALDQVFEYAIDPDNAPEWYENIKTAEWKSPKPLKKGSHIAFTASFLGRKLSYVYEITELVQNQRLVMRTATGPFPMETIYTWAKIDSQRTRMTLENRGIPTGFSKILAPFMTIMMRKANNKDLKKIKMILED